MTEEYLKKAGAFVKWMLPFILAMLLLFGCQSVPERARGNSQSESQAELRTTSARAPEKTYAADTPETGTKDRQEALASASLEETAQPLEEDGVYTGKDEVALYIHTFGRLPQNFITKRQAEELGWESREGNLWEAAPGMSIGGGRFGNYEEQLPDKEGRKWYECDIDYEGGFRGPKRIVYSNDGLIFYTGDHYETFEQLY